MPGRLKKVAREGLAREVPFTLTRADEGEAGDGLTLEGHAAVFDAQTLINSWEGRFTEEIAPGAFRKTFRERTPVLQFDHGTHPLLGSITLGRFIDGTPKEDDTGAFVRARLYDNWLVQPVRDAIEGESIDGMSFRFSVVREEWRDEDGKLLKDDEQILYMLWDDSTDFPLRRLKELKVPELGPVVFPAYRETEVSVRSGTAVIDLGEHLRANPEAGKTLARALYLAEEATLAPNSSAGTPQEDDAPAASEGTPQGAPAPAQENPPESTPSVTAAAARMRARMESLNRR